MKRTLAIVAIGAALGVAAFFGFEPLFVWLLEPPASEGALKIVVREESRGPKGERLAPIFLRSGKERPGQFELQIRVTPEGAFYEGVRIDPAHAVTVVNFFLRKEKKSEISIEFEQHALYFQAVELLDELRMSEAACIWLNSKEPNQPPEPTRASAGLRIKPEGRVAHL